MDPLRLQRPAAEGGGGQGNRLRRLFHANVEFRIDVDAHPVPRDQRLVPLPGHGKRQRVHVDGGDVVDDRPDEGAAVDHDFFAEETGSDERDFFCGPAIKPVHHPVDDENDDDGCDQPEDQLSYQFAGHGNLPVSRLAADFLEFSRLFGKRDLGRQTFHG